MPRQKHEAFDLHCLNVKDTKKSSSHHWTCRYWSKSYTSGATRLLQHLSKIGGQVAPCMEIPQSIADDISWKMSGGSNSSRGASSTHAPPLASGQRQRVVEREGVQPSLHQVTGSVRGSVAFLKERQRLVEIEIARSIIECNLAFNVLQKEKWKKMVMVIANVGPCEGWTGVSYTAMRMRKIDEEKRELIEPLT